MGRDPGHRGEIKAHLSRPCLRGDPYATCNRLIATYAAKETSLTISPTGLTMMACPPALMEQERRFVDLLREVKRFRIDGTGALVLETTSGKAITARR